MAFTKHVKEYAFIHLRNSARSPREVFYLSKCTTERVRGGISALSKIGESSRICHSADQWLPRIDAANLHFGGREK